MPWTQYVKEQDLIAANETNVSWPSLQQVRLLVKIALRHIGRLYHMVLRQATPDKLEGI